MLTSYGNTTIQTSAGRYTRACCSFRSDTSLANKIIRFSPTAFVTAQIEPTSNIANYFQAQYTTGTIQMLNLGYFNGYAWMRIIDDYTFEICFEFIAGRSAVTWGTQTLNSQLLGNAATGFVGFQVKVGRDNSYCYVPITVTNDCNLDFSLKDINGNDLNGFIEGQNLVVEFETTGNVNNNFEVGFYNKNITDYTDVFNGLGLSYAGVGSTVNTIDDFEGNALPNGCIIDGSGFQTQGGVTKGQVTIDGSCLQSSTNYGVYIIYKQNGQYRTCELTLRPDTTGISLNFDCVSSVTDCFGTSAAGNVTGVSPCVPLDFVMTIDTAVINQSLNDNGFPLTFDDYFVDKNMFEANASGATSGIDLPIEATANNILTSNGFTPSTGLNRWIVGCWELNLDGARCFLYKYVNIQYNDNVVDENGTITDRAGKEVEVLCAEDTEYSLNTTDKLFISRNGGLYSEFTNPLDANTLSVGDEICFKKVSQGTVTTNDCECPPCGDIPYRVVVSTGPNPAEREVILEITGGTSTFRETISGAAITGTNTMLITVPANQSFLPIRNRTYSRQWM